MPHYLPRPDIATQAWHPWTHGVGSHLSGNPRSGSTAFRPTSSRSRRSRWRMFLANRIWTFNELDW